jgi:hypothetical protein
MSNTIICPSCQQFIPEEAQFCPFCGQSFASKLVSEGETTKKSESTPYFAAAMVLGILIVLGLLLLGGVLLWQMNPVGSNAAQFPNGNATQTATTQSTQPVADTPTITESFTPTIIVLPSFTSTDLPTEAPTIELTYTLTMVADTPTLPVVNSCPGASPQRVLIGDTVNVCTKRDRLVVKVDPGIMTEEIIRVYPGSVLTIVGGPVCMDDSSWWLVSVPVNTKAAKHQTELSDFFYTDREYTGWVPEGSDEVDPYYLCEQ